MCKGEAPAKANKPTHWPHANPPPPSVLRERNGEVRATTKRRWKASEGCSPKGMGGDAGLTTTRRRDRGICHGMPDSPGRHTYCADGAFGRLTLFSKALDPEPPLERKTSPEFGRAAQAPPKK